MSLTKKIFNSVYTFVKGKHPNNTIFAFNYHNIRHVNRFMKSEARKLDSEQVFIDVGAGKSPYYPLFADKAKKYIAYDLESSLPKDEKRPIDQLIGFAEDINLPDNTADVMLSNQVLEHVLDPRKATAEAFRVLKSGGFFLGSVPHVSPVHLEPYDFRRYTDLGLIQLLEREGFQVELVEGNAGVFSSAAFMISMDLVLSKTKKGEEQRFNSMRALLLSPFIGCLNLIGLIIDSIRNSNRSASNLCFRAQKP